MNRPSHKEISRKLTLAKEAVSENRISILNPVSVATDTLELGLNLRNISNILSDLLEEIEPCELLAFRWLSKKLGCRVYFKFTLKETRLWLVSLHEDRKEIAGG
jgi:hypothetical protein